jgi:hypothetical protein
MSNVCSRGVCFILFISYFAEICGGIFWWIIIEEQKENLQGALKTDVDNVLVQILDRSS